LIGTALFNLALCHGLQGEISQAIALAEASLQSLEQVEGALPGIIRENLERWKAEFQPGKTHKATEQVYTDQVT